MKVVVANVASTLILWWRASLLASPTVVPASTVPWRWTAPVRARIASRSVVLPLWNGPTSAIHRGPELLVPLGPEPFCPINASLAGREVGPVFPALWRYRLRTQGGWQGQRFAGAEICYLTKLASTTVRASTALSIRPCDLYQTIWRATSATSSRASGSM